MSITFYQKHCVGLSAIAEVSCLKRAQHNSTYPSIWYVAAIHSSKMHP